LIDIQSGEYGFTYFPENGVENKWEIILNTSEISKICSNEKKYLKLWRCTNKNCTSLFQTKDESCFNCDFVEVEPVLPEPELLVKNLNGERNFLN
jgi:hypothetical protein